MRGKLFLLGFVFLLVCSGFVVADDCNAINLDVYKGERGTYVLPPTGLSGDINYVSLDRSATDLTAADLDEVSVLIIGDRNFENSDQWADAPTYVNSLDTELSVIKTAWENGMDVILIGDNGAASGGQKANYWSADVANYLTDSMNYADSAVNYGGSSVNPVTPDLVEFPFLDGVSFSLANDGLWSPGLISVISPAKCAARTSLDGSCFVSYLPETDDHGYLFVSGNAFVGSDVYTKNLIEQSCDGTTYCEAAGFDCVSRDSCSAMEENYFCSRLSDVCCSDDDGNFKWTVEATAKVKTTTKRYKTITVKNPDGAGGPYLTGNIACSKNGYDGCDVVVSGALAGHDNNVNFPLNAACTRYFPDDRHDRPVLNVKCYNNVVSYTEIMGDASREEMIPPKEEVKDFGTPVIGYPTPERTIDSVVYSLSDDSDYVMTWFSDGGNTTTDPLVKVMGCLDMNSNDICDYTEVEDCSALDGDNDNDGCNAGFDSDCGGVEGVDDAGITCFDEIDNDCDGMIDGDDDDLSCSGTPNFPNNELTVYVNEGWNLIYGFFEPDQIKRGDIVEGDIKAIYALMPNIQDYARAYPSPDWDVLELMDGDDVLNSGLWVYSEARGEMTYRLHFDIIPFEQRQIYEGWNFVGISPDMVKGLKLEDMVGDCEVSRSYMFDNNNQEWGDLPLSAEVDDNDAIGQAWVMKVEGDCNLGIAPPVLPTFPTLPGLDGIGNNFDTDEPLEIDGYELTNAESISECVTDAGDVSAGAICYDAHILRYEHPVIEDPIRVTLVDYHDGASVIIGEVGDDLTNDNHGFENAYGLKEGGLVWFSDGEYDLVVIGVDDNSPPSAIIFAGDFHARHNAIDVGIVISDEPEEDPYDIEFIGAGVVGEIDNLFSDETKIVAYLLNQVANIKQGQEFGVAFGIKNLVEGTTDAGRFQYEVTVSDADVQQNCEISEAEVESWITSGRSDDVTIAPGESHYDLIKFFAPEDAPLCTVGFSIDVTLDGVVYAQDSFDVEVGIRRPCADSDGGKNYFDKGETTGSLGEFGTDECCVSDDNGGHACDDSTGDSVVEGFCVAGVGDSEFYVCPNGCLDGACI
ncbi:hypothetical protein HN935_04065 [archaeon]|jgi:hypothetical protein|nr:hypothetical protein [archaeon]